MARYQVVGDCAHVVVNGINGPVTVLLYKGAPLPADVPQERIEHLLSMNLIARFGSDEADEALATGDESGNGDGDGQQVVTAPVVDDVDRAAAKAKLPADGAAPAKSAAQAVWVEYAVAKGYDYSACKGETKDSLVALTAK